MKKTYISPLLDVVEAEFDSLLAASPETGSGGYNLGGGTGGTIDPENGNTGSTGSNEKDDEWEQGSKKNNLFFSYNEEW